MYTGDKTQRITLRLNPDQMAYVRQSADMLGVSPSDYVRMVINLCMAGTQQAANTMIKEGQRRANEQTSIDNQL